ncbi:MAG: hypothetical protein MJH10_13975 [Epibacterium sp.]|nr:hypothetical protein [Epibacterium sp.]NQX74638.1 DUF3800 domain-containing protein [Epibacterium sp.]
MAKKNYIIFSDESDSSGKFYGNFFGGVLLKAEDRQAIEKLLAAKKEELNFGNELKWQKVTPNYLAKYKEFMDYYFTFVASGRLKVRIMFTQNIYEAQGLTKEQRDKAYFYPYYQFLKNAFGLRYCTPSSLDRVTFSIFLDQIPDTKEKINNFKTYLSAIPETLSWEGLNLRIPKSHIANVDSSEHSILQGLDVILGAMCFRLNDKHREKPEGARVRGKRTIAKEALYKNINRRIREIYPNFNIGGSTGIQNGPADRWHHQYRHWRFVPENHTVDLDKGKRRPPTGPT